MTTGTVIALPEFGAAMRAASPGFAARVAAFERQHGALDERGLGVLAQAAYFCWFEAQYESDFLEVCRAIGSGRPTRQRLCHEITPARWHVVNAYTQAVLRWLSVECPHVRGADGARVERVVRWLGAPNRARRTLAVLLLQWLMEELRRSARSAMGAGTSSRSGPRYADYGIWHAAAQRAIEQMGSEPLHASCSAALTDAGIGPRDAAELIDGVALPSPPVCHHRFTRYVDIKAASIGALRWRGNLPPDVDAPRLAAAEFLDAAAEAVRAWADGREPGGTLEARIHNLLGPMTAAKRSVALDFFLPPKDDLGTDFYGWVTGHPAQWPCAIHDTAR